MAGKRGADSVDSAFVLDVGFDRISMLEQKLNQLRGKLIGR
jgi:hypothetical protein